MMNLLLNVIYNNNGNALCQLYYVKCQKNETKQINALVLFERKQIIFYKT